MQGVAKAGTVRRVAPQVGRTVNHSICTPRSTSLFNPDSACRPPKKGIVDRDIKKRATLARSAESQTLDGCVAKNGYQAGLDPFPGTPCRKCGKDGVYSESHGFEEK